MKKRSFRKRLCCSVVAILSLFAVCGNNLHAADITFNKGVIPTTVTGFPQTQTVANGSTVAISDMDVAGSSYVLIGWNTMKMPLVSSLELETLVTKIGEFYTKGDLLTITEDKELYAVWAIDQNNDGYPDYGQILIRPTISSVFGPAGIPVEDEDEDGGMSLRSLPDWNNNYDLKVTDDSVYYVGCSYLDDNLICLNSPLSFETRKARPLIPMDLVIEYHGVLEDKSMIGGKKQKPLEKIQITADMISASGGHFSVDSLFEIYPFMFNSIEKDGQGILKMYFTKAGTDTIVNITDFSQIGFIPWTWTKPFVNAETGAYTDTLTIKFYIYNTPQFKSTTISQRVDTSGYIDFKHLSGTPLKYMMRSIDEQSWRPAHAPLSKREKAAIGDSISICFRELDRTIAYRQLIINDFLSDEFSKPTHPNYVMYNNDLYNYYVEHNCDSIWSNYFMTDATYSTIIQPTYASFMAIPGIDHQVAIQTCIMIFESSITVSDFHYSNATTDISVPSSAVNMAAIMMPAYGRYLASKVVVPAPCRNMFCFAFESRAIPIIQREIYIPQVEGVTTDPGYGAHYIVSQSDFQFTAKYTTEKPLKVTTNRVINGVTEELSGTLNDKGVYEYVIRQVTQNIELKFGPETVANASIMDGSSVWSYNNSIYIHVEKADIASIYSVAGQMVKRIELSEGDNPVQVERGVYIVTLKNGSVHKVVVK